MEPPSLERVLAESNLYDAWSKVKANKGGAGWDGLTVRSFEKQLHRNLSLLREEVLSGKYIPLPLLVERIPKKSGGVLTLAIPAVRDRVLQTAVALVLTPVFEAGFEDRFFAFRKSRAVEKAVERIVRLRDQGYKWVVDADIEAFFEIIDHQLLMKELKRPIKDPGILELIEMWLKNEAVDKKVRYCFLKGIPQGPLLSPLLVNFYLATIEAKSLGKNQKLVRFANDFIALSNHRDAAQEALELTEDVLDTLKLGLYKEKPRVVTFTEGFRLLGVRFILSQAFKLSKKFRQLHQYDAYITDLATRHHAPSSLIDQAFEDPGTIGINCSTCHTRQMREAFGEAGLLPPDQMEPEGALDSICLPPNQLEDVISSFHDPGLRALYLFRYGYVLERESDRFVIKQRGRVLQKIPVVKVDQIIMFGNGQITTQAVQFCLQERIPIFLLSEQGYFYGVIDSFTPEPVSLHRAQFARTTDSKFCLDVAKAFVRGNMANCKTVLLRYARKRLAPELKAGAARLKELLAKVSRAKGLAELRSLVGKAQRIYFSAIAKTISTKWKFRTQRRRPPTDPINAMLSYGYTLLFYNTYSLLRARGLNPHVGYLHPMRPGHPALVSDFMEEFRPIIVDVVVLNLVLNNRVSPYEFSPPGPQGCLIGREAGKKFLQNLENKLNAKIKHPVDGISLDYRRCIEHQANHLARVIRGFEPEYKPLILK